jgi:Mrp family chromosome partitioning ATPase
MNRLSDLDAAINAALQGLKGHQGFGVDDLLPLFAGKLTEATALEGRLREVRWALSVRGKDVRGASSTPAPLVPVPLAANPSPTTTRPTSNLADAAGPADLSPEQIAMENSQMAMYLNQQREAGGTLRRLRQTYFPGHPLLKAAEDELQTISGAIREFAVQYNARRARQGLAAYDPTSTVALEQLEANLTQSLQQTNNDLEALARLKRQVLNIREQIEQEKQNRDDLKRRIAAQDRLSRTPGRIQVMEIPSKPDRAETDSRPQFAAAGAAGGIVGGFAIVLIVGLMERRLRAAEDAGRFGMGDRPVIGLLPEIPEDLADPEKAVHAAYCVHGIRTSLQLWYGWLDRPVFAVSGAVSGTGKTTLTLALGLSFATARSRTLLIDFDLVGGGLTRRTSAVRRRPIGQLLRRAGMVQEPQLNDALARASAEGVLLGEMLVRLGYSRETDVAQALQRQRSDGLGVLDVLDGAKLEDCVVPTDVEHLAILPLGGAQAHHVGRVSPLATQRLIDAARAAYDVVLIDTGPVTGSLEAAAAAAAADGVLVTVSRGDAHAALARCAARLQSAGGRIAGVVFNRATARDFAAYERDGGSASCTVSWADRSSRPSRVAGGADEVAEAPFGEAALNGRFGPFGRAVAMAARPDTPAHR